jgi:hypothetical protein
MPTVHAQSLAPHFSKGMNRSPRRLSRPAVSPAAKLTNLDSPNLRGAWKEH